MGSTCSVMLAAVALTVGVAGPVPAAAGRPVTGHQVPAAADPAAAGHPVTGGHPESVFAAGDGADLGRRIEAHIARFGGQRLGEYQIVWARFGATMTFPVPASAGAITALARKPCLEGEFCLYENAWSHRDGGAKLALRKYGRHHLASYGWQDLVSSWENNQTDGAGGRAYETLEDGTLLNLFGACGYGYQDYVGDLANDRADLVSLTATC